MSEASFVHISGRRDPGLLLLCDHARNAFPQGYGTLGLPPEQLLRHIAYDIGAEALTRGLAERFEAPALHTCFSRLLIDANRGADDPTLVMRLSDGAVIPGNRNLDERERAKRISLYFSPYHAAIAAEIDAFLAAGIVPILFSIHSFTPSWRGESRPWHAGVLWDRDRRLAAYLLDGLGAMQGVVVGDNEPYDGALDGDTLNIHGTRRGIPHVLIEVRQDLIATQPGVDEWVGRLAQALEPAINDPHLRKIELPRGLP